MYLKDVFRNNKQFGSKDRKFYRNACYTWWRWSEVPQQEPTPEKLAQYLEAAATGSEALNSQESVLQRYAAHLEPEIVLSQLHQWFHTQAPVFAIPFKHKRAAWENYVKQLNATYSITDTVYCFDPNINLTDAVDQGLCRIQDVASFSAVNALELLKNARVWDCCSGAGGKALTITENNPSISLTTSDVRPQILENLRERFSLAGLAAPRTLQIDLEKYSHSDDLGMFDFIVADVPCTGSGTWRRTPEAAHYFEEKEIERQAKRQESIVGNALKHLKQDGTLLYITCSIFQQENMQQIRKLEEKYNLRVVQAGFTTDATQSNSDYIFRAILKRN